MANTFFKFKKFTVHQDKSAMKVCTDACLFGAIISSSNTNYKNALDIGTGTGLLSLMFAQNNLKCNIDAVEVNEDACKQAIANIYESSFKKNIEVYFSDIRTYQKNDHSKYEIIFSNPPFYPNDLKSVENDRNIAMHSSLLSYQELFKVVNNLLADDGIFYILIPYSLEQKVIQYANQVNLFSKERISVRQAYSHSYFRTIICFSKIKKECKISEISIKDDLNNYTPEFKNLLKDYYLNL